MFSKYEVYTTVQSIYCYADSDVLKNKLGIRDRDELKRAEEEFTAVKQFVLLQEPIKGRFTKAHLMHIHRFLFEDLYPFAGRIRREQISKGDTMFYPPDLIDRELRRVFDTIHRDKLLLERNRGKQLQNLSYVMAELNMIHPFREGNGRSIRELIRCMALEYGIHLNWGNTDRDTLLNAAVRSVDDSMAFCEVLTQSIEAEA
jgi:cell filamentation protein